MSTPLSREERVLGSVRPFRLSTATEITTQRRVFHRISGLTVGQFAENGFGFPFIPYPEIDSQNPERVRLSPKNVNPRFLFHPIYWIDPRITAPTESEMSDPSRWAIRMFYELLSFGLLNPETLQWLNPAAVRGVRYTPADIDSMINDAPSVFDSVRFFDGDRLEGYSSSDVLDASDAALERVRAIQQREITRIRSLKNIALTDAQIILGGQDNWNNLFARLQEVANAIDNDKAKGMPLSTYVDEIYSLKMEIGRYLASADEATLALSYEVADQVSYSNDAVTKLTAITALVKRGKGLISKHEVEMDSQLTSLFGGGTNRAADLVMTVSRMHSDLTDRLSLAYSNNERAQRNDKVLRSTDELTFTETKRTQQASESDFA